MKKKINATLSHSTLPYPSFLRQIPTSFTERVRRVQKYVGLFDMKVIRATSYSRIHDLKLYFRSIRGMMQSFYQRMLKQKHAVQLAKANREIDEIKFDLEAEGKARI